MDFTFDEHPEEMKIEIFNHLGSDDLIEATLVCPE